MDIRELTGIPIREYLAAHGCHPARERSYYGMYHSPYREDRSPSMKVDYNRNLWYDFGTCEGGSLIDLVMKMEQCTLGDAVRKLGRSSGPGCYPAAGNPGRFVQPAMSRPKPLLRICKVRPLVNPSLIRYLHSRKINTGIAGRHCPEVYYSFGGKEYFAIGFKNDSGGYELRNSHFKGSSTKDITSILTDSRTCLVFEGFMDYLSFLTFQNLTFPRQNIIVLNSVSNLRKAATLISSFAEVSAYLDNDNAGRNTLREMGKTCGILRDESGLYMPFKDFNEFLCNR